MSSAAAEQPPAADDTPPAPKDLSHDWVVAATVDVDERTARYAAFRQSFRTKVETRIDALSVYCKGCRRNIEDAADAPCAAKVDNTHLIGGTPGERAKRKKYARDETVTVMPGPRINRRGIAAYVAGGAIGSDDLPRRVNGR